MPTFEPPTHEEGIRSPERILRYFRLTTANSVVKVNGVFTSVRSPSAELLAGLTYGVDYFRGGYVYVVTPEVAAELSAAGFPVQAGYGETPYGNTPYGD